MGRPASAKMCTIGQIPMNVEIGEQRFATAGHVRRGAAVDGNMAAASAPSAPIDITIIADGELATEYAGPLAAGIGDFQIIDARLSAVLDYDTVAALNRKDDVCRR